MRYLTLILTLSVCLDGLTQTLENYNKALIVLKKAITSTSGDTSASVFIHTTGTEYRLGHYEMPGKTKEIHLEEDYASFPEKRINYLSSSFEDRNRIWNDIMLSGEDSIYVRGYRDKGFRAENSSGRRILELCKTLPSELLKLAFRRRVSLQFIEETKKHFSLSFSYGDNTVAVLHIDKKTFLVNDLEVRQYSSIYGDGVHKTIYQKYVTHGNLQVPSVRHEFEFDRLVRTLNYSKVQFDIKFDTAGNAFGHIPERLFNSLQTHSVIDSFEFISISPELDLVKIHSRDNKVLVAKFDNYLGVFETPMGIDMNLSLMQELATRYPDFPVRYLFVTHHHPDHAGGLASYAPQPITLVTTIGNKEYFEKLMEVSHSMESDNWKREPVNLKMEYVPLTGERLFKDNSMEVFAYEIGGDTNHTNEHLVYYFPNSKILWIGDLLFFDTKETVYKPGPRGQSVYNLIQTKNLNVDKIYTSWPLHGQKEYGKLDFLKKLLGN